jgi:hypothetical protein
VALHLTQYNVLSGMRPGTRNGTRYGMFSRQHTRLASGSCCGVGGFKRGENHQKCALAVFCQHTLAISRQKAGRICSQLLALDYTSSRAVQASRIDSSGMRTPGGNAAPCLHRQRQRETVHWKIPAVLLVGLRDGNLGLLRIRTNFLHFGRTHLRSKRCRAISPQQATRGISFAAKG